MPNASRREADGVVQGSGFVDGGGERLFHAQRRAAPVNVSSKGQQLFRLDHRDGFLANHSRCLLQVKLAGNGDHEHVVLSRFSLSDERLEHPIGVFA